MENYKGHKISTRRIDNQSNKNRWEVLIDGLAIGRCSHPTQAVKKAIAHIDATQPKDREKQNPGRD